MCGLFGFSNYGGKKIKDLADLTNSLARQSAVRGTDAAGIALCTLGNIKICKEAKPAYDIEFKHPDNVTAVIGHTRHSTQGTEKKNWNNHPFMGRTKNSRFALAHNGVIINDKELRKKYKLPRTKIETDSYIAVQLIESQRKSDLADAIRFTAEKLDGSFSLSILDDRNNLYLVKGDSPLSILHFPSMKLYVYASTDEILYKSLVDFPPLFKALKSCNYEETHIKEGDILKIRPDGVKEKSMFNYSFYCGRDWWDYGSYYGFGKNEYIDDLKYVAGCQGYSPDDVDELLNAGFTLEEIEDYIYRGCETDGEI